MSWDEKVADYAAGHHTYEHLPVETNLRLVAASIQGARWQRDQLRTDEAVERMADWLCEDDHGYTLAGHGEWCQDLACDLVESYRDSARAAIAALLGEQS